MTSARSKWWDDVVSVDVAYFYDTRENAEQAVEKAKINKAWKKGRRGSLIWGDRLRVLERIDLNNVARVSARGQDYPRHEMWMNTDDLGGEALLEVYVIDVGQGDGLLVVTPEGHHLMIDGGNLRINQNSGKNAADFVDWKFSRDYLSYADRKGAQKPVIQLDAIIASHCDQDHFGGLLDLLDLEDEKNAAELDCAGVQAEAIYHAGLSWWAKTKIKNGKVTVDRTLGPDREGHYTRMLEGRNAALSATANLEQPDDDTLSGSWGRFVCAATRTRKASTPTAFASLERISAQTNEYLPGFSAADPSKVSVRVLGPIEGSVDNKPALRKFPDGDSKNTNGHSIVLRLDYGDRRILLTGDLNTHSQKNIMAAFGGQFLREFQVDVAKGCHHGSHDVSYGFLNGLRPLATVISSGDAETYDHPRPGIIAASALTGRTLVEGDSLVAPLIYITEVSRSISLSKISSMAEFAEPRRKFEFKKPTGFEKKHDTEDEMARFRLFLGSSPKTAFDWPRLDCANVVRGLRYGLINIRTDGKRLFFAQLEESGVEWAVASLSPEQIMASR